MRKRKPRGGVFADYVTRRDIAKLLGVSTTTISRLETAGKLPRSIYFGGVKLYKKADVDAWIEQITNPQGTPPLERRTRKGKKT